MTVKQFNNPQSFSCNAYVLSSERGVIVIDPGYYGNDFREYTQRLGLLDAILLTHGHIDHVLGLDALKADFPNTLIYIGSKEQSFLKDPDMLCSSSLQMDGFKTNTETIPLDEGHYRFGSYEVDTILTPGHTFGALTYIFRDENIMFTGDALMYYAKTPTNRPTGNEQDRDATMQRFLHLDVPRDMMVYAGHGESVTMEQMRNESPDLKDLKR